jgi:hypothetical protein
MRRSNWLVLAAVLTGVLVGAVGVAFGAGHRTGTTTTITGGSVEQVRMVRSTVPFKTNGPTWKAIPGAATAITVPAGHHADILARFTGTFSCTADDGNPTGNCSVRIMIGSVEGQPATGTTPIAQVIQGQGLPVSITASVDRSRGPLAGGTYQVVVQERTGNALIGVEFDSWHLTVERIDAAG